MSNPEVVSPGHKLGQMIGKLVQRLLADDLMDLSTRLGYYCDRQGLRPGVRGTAQKVSWTDHRGNAHDLDYVIERNGSERQQGLPAAFIEIAWRRYTKHSRNKTGEILGALLPLRRTYHPSCRFLGAVLAGEYSDGGKNQLVSNGISVLHIPFDVLAASFRVKGVELIYPEKAPADVKWAVIRQWASLGTNDIEDVKRTIRAAIGDDYRAFLGGLEQALVRTILSVRLTPVYGQVLNFSSLDEAIAELATLQIGDEGTAPLVKFEIELNFSDGDQLQGTFHSREEAINFLGKFT